MIAVTGATGLLGRSLVARLSAHKEVLAVARHPPRDSGGSDLRWVRADLSAREPAAFPPGVEAVVHLAQSERFRDFPAGAADVFAVNVASTARLLDLASASGATSLVLASTGGVYAPSSSPLTEDRPLTHPDSFYRASKLAAEVLASPYADRMNIVILRFFFIYGPGQDRSMLVPRLIDSVAAGKPVQLAGGDGLRLNPIYVDDAAAATEAALDVRGLEIINVAGPESVTIREMAESIGRHIDVEPRFDRGPAGQGDLVADIQKQRDLLRPPSIRFADGVAGMLDAR